MKKPRNWKTLRRRPIFEHFLLSLSKIEIAPQIENSDSTDSPQRREVLLLESNDWVNIVALAGSLPNLNIVLIRQWRFGSASLTLEVPGGVVDNGETPAEAAKRELLEETGYRCGRLDALGVVQPNPALFNNLCHVFLARDLVHQAEPLGDGEEEIEVLLRPLEEVPSLIRSGAIQHALVVAAMHLYSLSNRNPSA